MISLDRQGKCASPVRIFEVNISVECGALADVEVRPADHRATGNERVASRCVWPVPMDGHSVVWRGKAPRPNCSAPREVLAVGAELYERMRAPKLHSVLLMHRVTGREAPRQKSGVVEAVRRSCRMRDGRDRDRWAHVQAVTSMNSPSTASMSRRLHTTRGRSVERRTLPRNNAPHPAVRTNGDSTWGFGELLLAGATERMGVGRNSATRRLRRPPKGVQEGGRRGSASAPNRRSRGLWWRDLPIIASLPVPR